MSVGALNAMSRVLLATAAIAMLAILADDLRVIRLMKSASSLIAYAADPNAPLLEHSVRDLKRAAASSPDVEPLRALGLFYYTAGRHRTAIRYLSAVVRREPDNLAAWNALAVASARTDPALHADAVRRLRALSPIAPPLSAPKVFSRPGPHYR